MQFILPGDTWLDYQGIPNAFRVLGQDFMSIPQVLPTTTINPTTPVDILGDASFLLHVFQKHLVPQLTIVPFGKKALWNIMNLPAALITLGDLTILE